MAVKAPEKPIDIRELVIDERKPKKPDFDPKDYIQESDWVLIEQIMKQKTRGKGASLYPVILNDMLLLYPDGRERVQNLAKDLEIEVKNPLTENDFYKLESLKVVFPDKFKKLKPDPSIFKDVLVTIQKKFSSEKIFLSYLDWLTVYKIIFPKERINFDSKEAYIFHNYKQDADSSEDEDFDIQIRMFADLKILFPEQFKKEGLPTNFWPKVKDHLANISELSDSDFEQYLHTVSNLAILAADEIKFTDSGIELVTNENGDDISQSTPELPETRSF